MRRWTAALASGAWITLFAPDVALAHDCTGFTDCTDTEDTALLILLLLILLILLILLWPIIEAALAAAAAEIDAGILAAEAEADAVGIAEAEGLEAVSAAEAEVAPVAEEIGGTLTRDQMKTLLNEIWEENPLLSRLSQARELEGEALQRELVDILQTFESETGVDVQFVDEGVVQAATREGNFASMRSDPGVLQIERQVLNEPTWFFEEVQHEVTYHYAGGPGGVPAMETWNAHDLLELMIQSRGRFPLD
jgi:hypothetical protein